MAIGVRITSENLIGQTVDVVFQPMTGGTPISLGIKTIPFNYYSELPYGEYILSSITYDYVYTLNVQQPYGQNQNFAQLGNVSGETNYSLGFLNFNNFTAEIIDLGIDATYWSNNTWYPLSESGSLLSFYNYGDNARLTLFLNENGNIVEQFSAITIDSQTGVLDGRIGYFQDPDSGIFLWFNGNSVYQYTYDPLTESLEVLWDWDATCLDNTFFFKIRNTGTTTDTVYKVSNNGSVLLFSSWDYTIEVRYYGTYYPSNYFYEFVYLQSDGSVSSIKFYNTSGTEIADFSIPPNTYKSWNYQWYGNNSFNVLLWDNSDNNIDYLIYNFNGVTENVTSTTHVKGDNYYQFYVQSEYNFYPIDVPSGGIFIQLLGDFGTYYQGAGYEVKYLDIIYRLENETDFTTYTYQDSGSYDKQFNFSSYGNKNYYTFCSTGDSISSLFSITESGVNIFQTNQNINDVNNTDSNWFGDYFNYITYTDSYTTLNSYLFLDGQLVDTLILNTPTGRNIGNKYQTFYISNYTGDTYYINNQVTGYTKTEYYNNNYTSNSYYTQQYYFTSSNILLNNEENFTCKMITKDSVSNQFSVPIPNGSWQFLVGRDNFLYIYLDNSNNTRINLYNLKGALLNSKIVEINGWEDIFAVKDRYVVTQITNDDQYLLTMISDTKVEQITIDNQYSNWLLINDYIWWD